MPVRPHFFFSFDGEAHRPLEATAAGAAVYGGPAAAPGALCAWRVRREKNPPSPQSSVAVASGGLPVDRGKVVFACFREVEVFVSV